MTRRVLDTKKRLYEIYKTNHHIKIYIKYRFTANLRSSVSNLKDGLSFLDVGLGKELTRANLSLMERNCEWMNLKIPPSCLEESEQISNINGAAHNPEDKLV